ncbi:MAG: PaaI family thioesterase [Jiangellaceae bacterium]
MHQVADMDKGLTGLIGLELDEVSADRVTAHLPVRPELHQPFGILHGGVHCAVVETLASVAAALWLGDEGHVVGVSNQTDFLRAVSEGKLRAEALPVFRGRTQQLWSVQIWDDDDRLVAKGQVRLQNVRSTSELGRPA